jgi:DHA3 family macrolide efflux protein-like MFS transporter
MPSAMKLLKRHVPEQQLQPVMAMFQTLMAIFMVIGPIVGTYVYQSYGIYVSIGVMGAMFLLSAAVLSLLPKDMVSVEDSPIGKSFKRGFKEGFRYVFDRRILKTLGGTFAFAGLAVGLIQPLMIFVAIDNLGMDKTFLQWLLMANGAAMLIGGGLVFAISKNISVVLSAG